MTQVPVFDSEAVFAAVSASEALERWRFKPVEQDGVVVPQRSKLRIRFDLE